LSYNEILQFLYSLQRFGIKFGLNNTFRLLQSFNNPHHAFKSIHIAGTNGKGSTAALIASILMEMNYKVGLYTSPHLVKFNERIQINGELITDDNLIFYTHQLKEQIVKIKPTFFEVTTAIAFKYFADKNVDYAVIETGLGGRLDSTNVIKPVLSVITSIGFDHMDILGDSLDKIALEKSGIIKEGVPVVIGFNPDEAKKVILTTCKERNAKYVDVENEYIIESVSKSFPMMTLNVTSKKIGRFNELISPFYGEYQVKNIVTSIAAIALLFDNSEKILRSIMNGIENMNRNFVFRGRFQKINGNPTIILDTAHNSSAFSEFLPEVAQLNIKNKIAVFGIMKDKEIKDSLKLIVETFDKVYTCHAKTERALNSSELMEQFVNNSKIVNGGRVDNAIQLAIQESNPEDFLVIFGSNFVVGEAIEYLELSGYKRKDFPKS
jgi:dihydrofolate synthase/folylpolyglutamate synthase